MQSLGIPRSMKRSFAIIAGVALLSAVVGALRSASEFFFPTKFGLHYSDGILMIPWHIAAAVALAFSIHGISLAAGLRPFPSGARAFLFGVLSAGMLLLAFSFERAACSAHTSVVGCYWPLLAFAAAGCAAARTLLTVRATPRSGT
jgi:hypothetical protein